MMTNEHPVGDCVRFPETGPRVPPLVPIGGGIIETIFKWLLGGGGIIRDPHPEPGPPEILDPWRNPHPGPDEWPVLRRSATAGVSGE